jgi:hypothetical protein
MGMWTDQLTAGHNGGPPYNTAQALAKIPRDTWMFNWSSSLAPLHAYEMADLGFEMVLEANSYGVNRERGQVVKGNCVGIWDKLPWLAETVGRPSEYDYQKLIHGAEYGWRLHPALDNPKPHPDRAFAETVRAVETAAATRPEPAAGPKLELIPPPADGVELTPWFDHVTEFGDVPLWSRGLAPGATIALGRRVVSLWWWQLLDADDTALEALREGIKDPANLTGVPAGTLRVTYQDGTTVDEPIRFGWDIRPATPAALPAAYGAADWQVLPRPGGGETAVYLRQWVNLQPDKVVASVALGERDGPGRVLVVGMAAREVKGER